ncbi:tRNA (mnm(5)s(2)U34)-methyltransferase [Amphibacillus cookii]|uniref:tRNA (mnm(5)s(2)U34)-methyltransferase n=1 Tax=Amphibacillus cookii TaxID=767787 RepID=UPI0019566057|nr:class I SAM-dependent methyltransferase [Amphibacillus cookii]MBM7541402.1 putative methyltransferase [Amphibacillus cookii]
MLKRVIPYAHQLIQQVIQPGELVIDATCGNGHDTVMLSEATGPNGIVYAFDIQAEAIINTQELLKEKQLTNVELIHDSHQNVDHYLEKRADQQLAGAIFNLGYLPGSDKAIVTKPTSTILAIEKIASRLKVGGIIVCVVYHGHLGGTAEKEALLDHLKQYDQKQFNVLQYGFINQKNHPPFILAIEKKQAD